jgi:hypothetical protein
MKRAIKISKKIATFKVRNNLRKPSGQEMGGLVEGVAVGVAIEGV